MTRPAWIITAIAAVLYVALAHFFCLQTGDDSFIFYRIVENLIAGHGPVFNAGERVEAYSSPAWLGVLAMARLGGADLVLFSRWAGIALVAWGVWTSRELARRLGASDVGAALVLLACALTGSVHYWAPAGLEVSLYMCLLPLVALAIVDGRTWRWAAATAVLGLVRPEGLGMLVASTVALAIANGRRALKPAPVAAAIVPAVAYFAFRLSYFGAPFPNTYYAKATGPLLQRVGRGSEYAMWLLCGLGVIVILLARSWRKTRITPVLRAQLAVLALVSALLVVVLAGGGDWMWGHRLSLPAFPPTFAVLASLVLPASVERLGPRLAAGLALVVAMINDDLPWRDRLLEASYFGTNHTDTMLAEPGKAFSYRYLRMFEVIGSALVGGTMDHTERIEGTMTDAARDVGAWLREHDPERAAIAVNHAGAVPYYAGLPSIDMVGLADKHIAREVHGGLHMKFDPDYVLGREPKFIVLNARTEPGTDGVWYHEGYWEGETALVRHPVFQTKYRAVPKYWRWDYSNRTGNFILVYERAD